MRSSQDSGVHCDENCGDTHHVQVPHHDRHSSRKCSKKHSSVHSGKDPRKRSRNQICERARKERLGEWSGVEAVGSGVGGPRIGVNFSGHSGRLHWGRHTILRVSATKGGS